MVEAQKKRVAVVGMFDIFSFMGCTHIYPVYGVTNCGMTAIRGRTCGLGQRKGHARCWPRSYDI
jgi:hypothetical protein